MTLTNLTIFITLLAIAALVYACWPDKKGALLSDPSNTVVKTTYDSASDLTYALFESGIAGAFSGRHPFSSDFHSMDAVTYGEGYVDDKGHIRIR